MSNQMPSYSEEQRWYSQPRASYPNGDGYGRSPQPQAGYQGQTVPASPYPGNQGMYPQQLDFAGNNLYAGNSSYASSSPYAVPPAAPTMYQPPASPYAPPPVPGVYASPYMPPYGMVDPNQGKATTGLVFGIITAILGLIWWIGSILSVLLFIAFVACGILGIVFSAMGRRSFTKKTSATVGLVLSIVGLVIGFLILIAVIIIAAAIAANNP